MTFSISFGKYGGFYYMRGATIRLCVGWMALTWFPFDIDDVLESWVCSHESRKAIRAGGVNE